MYSHCNDEVGGRPRRGRARRSHNAPVVQRNRTV